MVKTSRNRNNTRRRRGIGHLAVVVILCMILIACFLAGITSVILRNPIADATNASPKTVAMIGTATAIAGAVGGTVCAGYGLIANGVRDNENEQSESKAKAKTRQVFYRMNSTESRDTMAPPTREQDLQ